ncbi:hypothetical protein AU156_gp165 [Edwardsiella phage PEi20]|uniref:SprT-like domain-containing protein n=1 Tax=Edwardsiella phage PEi20 TaxID=1608310 RepID=A0A0B6VLD4_9CAUD|nr:hypothetical protein AU156_gp165 [Edwardsiella phage PEi20]BAQ22937.1 conserved hypothetical protein [Edwardsiella phage PEi20]
MNLIDRILSKAFYLDGHLYHSVESAKGFFEGKCKQHGLEGWSFHVVSSTSKRNIGYCSAWRKKIAIQAHFFFAMTAAQVEETILHELAHALCPGEGHSKIWRAKAIELGDTHARATTPIKSGPGFRIEWMINSGHTRQESEFDVAAFTNHELPRSKKPSSPNFGGPQKRVVKPTKLAISIYHEKEVKDNNWLWMDNFKREFMNCGYNERYALVQWDLCKKMFA